ncbi:MULTISPECIES: hypothetical protein [unclassified Methylobacterium]|jgi:hypothetical protein|uniref:hypothetical protein n=1 Tax=unclassified Methylobacterium TaxID=2615210 RepID=UPI001353D1F8|nr:hypothetical protein [Methylobacterium sp. 2A]MWV21033.1 hypothetical protein [Methylobacterium sp. 2A]
MSTDVARRNVENYYNILRAQRRDVPTALSEADQRIVTALREAGVYQTRLEDLDLVGSEQMLSQARDVRRDIEMRVAAGPAHLDDPYLIQANKIELKDRPDIYLFGLNERLLRIVENYLGLPVAFGGFNFFYTLADGCERGARVWHLDGEDESIVKIAIYLNDVGEDGGPFEMIRSRLFKGARPYTRPARHEKLERIIGRNISADEIVTCTGPTGSVIFCDTARYYHRGKPATGQNRTAIFFNYYPRPPRRPYFCGKPIVGLEDFAGETHRLTDYQRQSALWRDNVPSIAKYLLPR